MAMQRQPRSHKNTASNHKTPRVEQGAVERAEVQPEEHTAEPAALAAQVHELKAALEQSQQQEKSLQSAIEQLRSQVEDRDTQVHELKAALEQSQQQEKSLQSAIEQLRSQVESHDTVAQRLHATVEDAQRAALNLAESNQTLIDENKQLRATAEKMHSLHAELEKAQLAAHQLAESNQSLLEQNKTLKEKQATEQSAQLAKSNADADLRSHQDILKKRQAAALAHPIFPDSPAPAKVSDQELGWFD